MPPKNLPQQFGDGPVTVLVVRHAERGPVPANDPPLTPAGEERARELVKAAGNAGIKAIYTTQYVRSVQTARPLAEHLGITPTVLDVSDLEAHVQDLIARIRTAPARTSVLVVSHTNTIPMLGAALRAAAIPPIADDEFDKLFIIETPKGTGKARIIRARYGAPSS